MTKKSATKPKAPAEPTFDMSTEEGFNAFFEYNLSKSPVDMMEHLPEVHPERAKQLTKGMKVRAGGACDTFIKWISKDKRVAYIEGKVSKGSKDSGAVTGYFMRWYDIHDQNWAEQIINEEQKEFARLLRRNSFSYNMETLISRIESGWICPEKAKYQRGYVWTMEDKTNLIDNLILNGMNLGQVVFAKNNWDEPSDIIDGKQRISTLWDFIQGKFTWKGLYHWQLNPIDRYQLNEAKVGVMELERGTDELMRLKIFMAINASGVPQTKAHLNAIQERINVLEQEKLNASKNV